MVSRLCRYAALLLFVLSTASAFEIENKGWWKNTPFYQIYPRSFKDSNGDGIGDLKGITEKLDHFVDAGISAIWLSPIYASPMADFGYDISDFTDIHPDYGNMADFEELTAQAKSKGLKVILDLVPNHSSDEHDWFKNSLANDTQYRDFYVWKPCTSEVFPNNWLSVFGGPAWTYSTARKECYLHQFHKKQPDLNYRNPLVRAAMMEVIMFWVNKGVNGFRVDAVPHLFENATFLNEPVINTTPSPPQHSDLDHIYTKDQPETYELVKSWRELLDVLSSSVSDELIMMTEAYTSLTKTVEFYDAGAHVPFNFKFITDVNNTSPPSDFKRVIDTWSEEANKRNGTSNWVMGNHDNKRTETRYPGRGDQMTMLAMILPGVSVTYYGEEIGMVDNVNITWIETQDPQGCLAGQNGYKELSRDPCRTPFQWDNSLNAGFGGFANATYSNTWLPIPSNYKELNLAAQKKSEVSHFKLFKELTTLKKNSSSISTGTLDTSVLNNDEVLVIARNNIQGNSSVETLLLVMNFNPKANVTVDLTNQIPVYRETNGTIEITSLNSNHRSGASVNLTRLHLDPHSAVVVVARDVRPKVNGGNALESNSFITATAILVVNLFITLR